MGKQVILDDEVYEKLKTFARPLEDTPNSVVKRLMEVAETFIEPPRGSQETGEPARPPRLRLRSSQRTPQSAFRPPILEALEEMGGTGAVSEVLDRVREKMKARLTDFDFTAIRTGEERWRVYARWERKNMVLEGLLTGPHGFWQLTEKGRAYLRRAS